MAVTETGEIFDSEREWPLDEPRPESPRTLAWRRFRRDRLALASGIFLAIILFACFPGASLYERAIGHGPGDQFPGCRQLAGALLLFLVVIGSAVNRGMREWTLDGTLEKGVFQLIVLIGVFTWFYPARLVRTHILSLRHREFVEAAQMVGARETRILRTHLLPHVLPPLLTYGTLLVATNVMLEVGATFLNAGISLGTPSWGGLLAQTWGSILSPNPNTTAFNQPWLTVIPSAAIFLTVFTLNQFGEGLREATDPQGAR